MNPESGLPERTFTNPAPSDEDQFGFSVAAGQMDILVGAPQGDPYFTDSGWVWVYDSASGAAVLRFDNPSPGIGDRFGAALSPLVDGMFAVGAPNDDAASIDTGSVSIFQGRP